MSLLIFYFFIEFIEQKVLYNEIIYDKNNDINKGYLIFQNFYVGFFFYIVKYICKFYIEFMIFIYFFYINNLFIFFLLYM